MDPDSICYMSPRGDLLKRLMSDAQAADELHSRSRALLIRAVRAGSAAGLTQREIAAAVGRSQPEVSRLLRFHGSSERARALSAHRRTVLDIIRNVGGRGTRVFGSVAVGLDTEASDIDLLVEFDEVPSLMALARLERKLSAVVGYPVEVTPAGHMRKNLAAQVRETSVPL